MLKAVEGQNRYKSSVAEAYSRLAESYDRAYSSRRHRVEDAVVRSLLSDFGLVGPVLDIGTGTGLLFDWFPDIDGDGYDIAPGMIEVAKKKHPGRFFEVGDALDYRGRRVYKTVTSLFSSLSYVPPAFARDAVWKNLASGGRFFVVLSGERHKGGEIIGQQGIKLEHWTYSAHDIRVVFRDFVSVQVRPLFRAHPISRRFSLCESRFLSAFGLSSRFFVVEGAKP